MSLYLNYSVSPRILDGHSKEEANKIVDGYKQTTIEWTESEIKALLIKKSIAPAIFKTGKRILKDVMGYQFIMLDFDSPTAMPAKSMIDLLKAKYPDIAFAVFSSSRHQLEYTDKNTGEKLCHDKYRVLFPLGTSLNKQEVDNIGTYFFSQYPKLDGSCFMLARYFYRGTDQVWYFNPGTNYLNIDEIIAETIVRKKSKNIKDYIKLDTVITTADGEELVIGDINKKTTVFCPFHRDENASAFVDFTLNGSRMLFCSSCQSKNLGTNQNGTYYLEHPKASPQNTFLFHCKATARAAFVDSHGKINNINAGNDWRNFCANHNVDEESYNTLLRADFTYDPTKPYGFTEDFEWFNLFKPSEYIQNYPNKIPVDLAKLRKIAPIIYAVIENVCGTKEKIKYILNWFAYLLQTNRRIGTALLIQSKEQGVGKDLLFSKVWTPIFGELNTKDMDGSAIGERFTGHYARARLIRFNECFANRDYNKNMTRLQWLKNRITGIKHEIEAKGQEKVEIPHYCAYILHSNDNASFSIEQEDRRFVVITNDKARPIKKFPWYVTQDKLEEDIAKELPAFAEYIQSIEVNPELANNAITTAAKQRIQEVSKDETLCFAEALRDRDADYFDIEDVINKAQLDDTIIRKDIIETIRALIEQRQAIPVSYMDLFIKTKIQGLALEYIKKILAGNGVVKRVGTKDIRVFLNGKSYRAYKYVQVTDNEADYDHEETETQVNDN